MQYYSCEGRSLKTDPRVNDQGSGQAQFFHMLQGDSTPECFSTILVFPSSLSLDPLLCDITSTLTFLHYILFSSLMGTSGDTPSTILRSLTSYKGLPAF